MLRAADREGLPCHVVEFNFERAHLVRKFGREPCEMLAINLHAFALHRGNDGDKRTVDAFVNRRDSIGRQARLEFLPQPQRNIGIFSRVTRGIAQRHLRKAQLVFTRAADVFVSDAAMAKVKLRQFVHAMIMASRVEREAEHQRIVERRDQDAVPRENGHVIFEILADFQDRWIGHQPAQSVERRARVDLVRLFSEQIGAAMRERDIARLARRGRETEPDDPCLRRVEPVGLGIDRDDAACCGFGNPAVEGIECCYAVISVEIEGSFGHRRRFGGGGCGHRWRYRSRTAAQFGQQRAKAMMLEKRAQRVFGNALEQQIVERFGQVAIILERDEHARKPRHVGMFDQVIAQLARFHCGGRCQYGLQIAMLDNQLCRSLWPDTGHTGDIVDRVTHQRQHIAEAFWPHAEFLDHFGRVDPPVVHRVIQVEAGLDQLHQILVGRHDRDRPALRQRGLGIASNDVIGLESLGLDTRQRERPRGITDHRELRHKVFGRRRALRLVFVVEIVAEGFRRFVEDDRHMRRPVGFVQRFGQFPQHRGVAIDSADRFAANIGQRRQAVIGAEDIARAVDKIEVVVGHVGDGIAEAAGRYQSVLTG